MLDLSQDVGCRSRPDEWTGVVVVLSNVLINGLRQLCHAAEGSPTDALASDLGKPALHQVQPGSPRGGEVQVIAGMSCEPGLYLEIGMGAVVVEDHMNVPGAAGAKKNCEICVGFSFAALSVFRLRRAEAASAVWIPHWHSEPFESQGARAAKRWT